MDMSMAWNFGWIALAGNVSGAGVGESSNATANSLAAEGLLKVLEP